MSSPKNALSGARLALAALLCAALPARAADQTTLRPMLDIEQGWDSNVFNSSNSSQGSFVTRLSPGVWIENTGELGTARLGLTGVSRTVWQESTMSGIDGLAHGDFERKLTPRLSVFGDGFLDHYSGYQQITEGGPQTTTVLLGAHPAWDRDHVGGGYSYLLSPRLSLRMTGSAGRVNYERVDIGSASQGYYRDQSLYGGTTELRYQLTALDQVSLGVDVDDTQYQDLGFGTNDSNIWSSSVGWTRSWSPAWSTRASLGISELYSTQAGVPTAGGFAFRSTCDINLGGGIVISVGCSRSGIANLGQQSYSSSGTGLIGSLAIARTFERGSIELSYDRDTRSTGGSGRTNFDIDSFTLAVTQRLAERVKLTLTGNYSMYQSANDKIPNYQASVTALPTGSFTYACGAVGGSPTVVGSVGSPDDPALLVPVVQCTGGSSTENRYYTTLTGRLDWQLRRSLNAYVVARYFKTTTDQSLGAGQNIQTENFDRFTIGAGFRYYWDVGL